MIVFGTEDIAQSACLEGAVIAFGVFDGVHTGHQYLFEKARARAEALQAPFVILSFDKDPDELFRGDVMIKICTNEQRYALLEAQKPACVALLSFTREFASIQPLDFLERVFGNTTPRCVFVGEDFHFGAKGAGSVADMQAWGSTHGMEVCPVALLQAQEKTVCATRIRALLQEGKIQEATELLGHHFVLEGKVYPGRHEGAGFGFKTANLFVAKQQFTVAEGVYAGYAWVNNTRYKAAISMGVSPTFDAAKANCEVHILDFDGDIYGEEIAVEFKEYLRPMIKFDSVDELIATVMSNIQYVRDNL